MRTSQRAATIAALLIVTATGCSGGKAPDAVTIATGTAASSTASGPAASAPAAEQPSSPAPQPAPDPLTAAQAKAALPPAARLGSGWKTTKSSNSNSKTTTSPASCAAVYDQLNRNVLGKAVVKAERDYERSVFGPLANITVSSYSTVPAPGVFDSIAAAVGKCPKFTSTSSKGVKTKFQAGPLKFPNVGDQTFAMTLNGSSSGLSFSAEVAITTSGSSSVAVITVAIGRGGVPAGLTARAMKATVSRLP